MALTKVSTDGVKDDAITKSKIPANAIEASELADNAVDTNAIANDAVTSAKIADSTIINGNIAADTIQLTKLQNMAVNHILGRSTSGTGNPEILTAAQVRTILNVANGATFSNINGNVDHRVLTATGTTGVSQGESGLTYNGQAFQINSVTSENNAFRILNTTDNSVRYQINGEGNSFIGHTYPRADASIDLGFHSGYRWRDLVLSGGVRFGSANASDYLDDYEEGTWTPNFDAPDQSSTTFGHHRQHGYYTKIGNIVHVACYIQGFADQNNGGGSNDGVVITGLPFTVAPLPSTSNIRHAASFALGSRYRVICDDLLCHAFGNTTNAGLWEPSSGNVMGRLKTNDITARGGTNEILFSGAYRVA